MDDSRFEFDASFIKPSAKPELAQLAALRAQFPGSPASIFAHTDPVGDDAYNKPLSGRRALALYGLLVRDVDVWEELHATPTVGDQWGATTTQHMLSALSQGDGTPYYDGPIDGWYDPQLQAAAMRWQEDSGLAVDGVVGPATRASLFAAYMEYLATGDLRLTDDDFLARGADPEHRGDVQGCGEHNPQMVFSEAEHAKYQAWEFRDERNEENSINRRAVVFLYPAGVVVDPAIWPCPAAREGIPDCRARFWSDGDERRSPVAVRRYFDGDFDTFACRFYHYFGFNTAAETPVHLGLTLDVYVHHGEAGPGSGSFRLESDDGEIDTELASREALPIQSAPDRDVGLLSFTMLPSAPRYTLSFRPEGGGPEFDRIVLLESFLLSELGAPAEGTEPNVCISVAHSVVNQEVEPLDGAPPVEAEPLPEHVPVETQAGSIGGMPVTIESVGELDPHAGTDRV